ncbi:MAG: autotransporter assembly complex family protein [Nitrospirota bacterium]
MAVPCSVIRLPGLALILLIIGLVCAASAETVQLPAVETTGLEVEVVGVEDPLRSNILSYLTIEQRKHDPFLTPGTIAELHEQAPDEIRRALQPFGFYTPEISADLIRRDRHWTARYAVKPGRPVIIGDVDVRVTGAGAEDRLLMELREDFPVKVGDRLQHQHYEKAKQDLLETAINGGYLDAVVLAHEVKVYPDVHTATITLHLDTGPLYRFGEVTFEQEAFRQEFLSRFVPFKKGDPYRLSDLFELQNDLTGSDYFSSVDVVPRKDEARDHEVPITVQLTPKKRQRYTFGIGYGTDTGFRGILGWENRRVNRRGHRFLSELQLSEVKQSFVARYIVPMRRPATDSLNFSAGLSHENTLTSESEVLSFDTSYARKRGTWLQTFYLALRQESFTIGDEEGSSRLLMPGTVLTRITADDRIYTTRGSRIILEFKGAHEALGSDTSFVQFRTGTKLIFGPWETGRVILRGDLGASVINKLSELPATQRFFAGGDQSVRGYAYNSLGPRRNDDVIGGKYLIVGSVEYEQSITRKWGIALFYDVGNAVNKLSDPLKQGTGLGVRWKSPIGLVRVDFAVALNRDPDESRWRIHFLIGPDL